jgi:hypothetical protein
MRGTIMKTHLDHQLPTKIRSAAEAVSGQRLSDANKAVLGTLGALMLALSLLIAAIIAGGAPAFSQQVKVVAVDVKQVTEGYRASKIIGAKVQNDKNENIGTLDDIVIGKQHDLYAILQVGGFLGIGAQLVAVSYDNLTITDNGSKIILPGASKEELTKLPKFEYKA